MRIADWNAVSAGRPWFASDGLHLNAKGAMALAGLLRKTCSPRSEAEPQSGPHGRAVPRYGGIATHPPACAGIR